MWSHPFLTTTLVASMGSFAMPAVAQTIHVEDLVKAAQCGDLPCFEVFALGKAFVVGGSDEIGGVTLYFFLSPQMNADSSHDELEFDLPGTNADTTAVPSVTYAFSDKAIYERMQAELAAFGLEPSDEGNDMGGAIQIDYFSEEHPEIQAWVIVSTEDAPDGGPATYQVGVVHAP